MAQTDLVAQKILATDPQVGFGEGSVLPYRHREPNTAGYEAMERRQVRAAKSAEDRKKNNEDYYNTTIKNLPEYEREFDKGLSGWRGDIVNKSSQVVKSGGNVSATPDLTRDILAYHQAANATKQMKDDLQKMDSIPMGKYINRDSVKGAALKQYTEKVDRANQGDKSAFSERLDVDLNDPEHFMFNDYYNDRYSKTPNTTTGEDKISYNGKGERILGNKVTAKFVTKDANGKVVPGIDQSLINNELYNETSDPDQIQSRAATYSLVDRMLTKKASELKLSDPKYADMGVSQIVSNISANPKDPNYKDFNKNKLAEDIVRKEIEKHQVVSTDKSISALNEYDNGSGSGGDKNAFRIVPATLTQPSASGHTMNAPGVVLSKGDKPLVFPIAPSEIHDFGQGLNFENNDRVKVTASGLGYAMRRKKEGTLVSFKSPDEMLDYINKASKADLAKLDLKQFIFGNIDEKKGTEGDTGGDKPGNKREQNVNRSVAVEYTPGGETGALLDVFSDGAFAKRKLTPIEQSVKDAWDKRMAEKPQTKKAPASKPKTVTQNGVLYTFNEKTGQYE